MVLPSIEGVVVVYIIIATYDEGIELYYHETIEEVEEALVEMLQVDDYPPTEVGLAIAVTDAPTTRVYELINTINDKRRY